MLKAPSKEVLIKLETFEKNFPAQIAISIKWIYNTLGWNGEDMAERISGIQPSVWNKYAQQGYTKQRPQHAIAALSWITQISMSAIMRGKHIADYWEGVSQGVLDILIACGRMTHNDFEAFIKDIQSYNKTPLPKGTVNKAFLALEMEKQRLIAPPPVLDLDDFRKDYYRSIAIGLRELRKKHTLSIEEMALAGNLTPEAYEKYEDIENPPKSIPIVKAARFKIALNVQNTTVLLEHMQKYQGCGTARYIQQLREQLLIEMLRDSTPEILKTILPIAQSKQIYRESLEKFRVQQPVLRNRNK